MADSTLGSLATVNNASQFLLTPKGELMSMVLHFLMAQCGLPNKEAWALTRTYVTPLWQDVETLLENRAQQATTTEGTHA